jgi:putative ABC transport system substrate-binding protein
VGALLIIAAGMFYIFSITSAPNGLEEKVYRIGVLSGLDFFAETTDGFKEKMAELGYIEGKNIVYDIQTTNFDIATYRNILNKFVVDKVDLIFVFPTEASQEAKAVSDATDIPVIFSNANTEDTNLVKSIREPGGAITGVRWSGPDIAIQRFRIMQELAPQTKRMFIPYQRDYPIIKSELDILYPAAKAANITLVEIPANDAKELEIELQKKDTQINPATDAILILAEPLCVTPEPFVVLASFAEKHHIPIGGPYIKIGEYESLFGFTPQDEAVGKQAAYLADKVLQGIPAGTIPVISADGYLQINYRMVQKLGLTIPESLLRIADDVLR